MVVGSIQERIKKMKEAILTEAKQRSHMIIQNAEEEADQERARIYNEEKEKITQQFAQLTKQEKVQHKIERSALHNRHRIKRMEERYKVVERLREEVHEQLRKVVTDKTMYPKLLKNLIVQGMLKMMEHNVSVEMKEGDMRNTKGLFKECEKEFKTIMKKETGWDMQSILSASTYTLEEQNTKIIGGIFLRSNEGVIVCDNSIDSRVRLIFEQLLPIIRNQLFPVRR